MITAKRTENSLTSSLPMSKIMTAFPTTKLGLFVWAFAILYAPLAFTYFWDPVVSSSWKVQDVVIEWFTTHAFAHGEGSGYDGHLIFYDHAATRMVAHSVAGSIVTTIGLLQFSDSLRSLYPKAHRLVGYFYMICALIIPLTASWFLVTTGARNIFSGPQFALILWLLAFGTFITAAAALYEAAIAHRFERHRDLMAFNYAYMLSAPLLRYGWIGVYQFWPETKETINMTEGFWAGPVLMIGAIFYIRSIKGYRRQIQRNPLSKWITLQFVGVSAIGTTYLAWNIPGTTLWRPDVLFGWTVPVIVVEAILFAVLDHQALPILDDKAASRQYWRTNLLSLCALPGWSAISFAITRHILNSTISEAWYGAFMGGLSLGLFVAASINIYSTKYARDFSK